jgi:hypothetical protein
MLASSQSDHTAGVNIAGLSIRLHAEDPDLRLGMDETMNLFRTSVLIPDIDLSVSWGIPALAPHAIARFDSGATWKLFTTDQQYIFQFQTPFFGRLPYKEARVSADFSRGEIYLRPEAFPGRPVDPFEYPLDELLMVHLLARGLGIELHGCGLIADGEGILFLGHSGAGKSTIGELWQQTGQARILSDDRIIIRQLEGRLWMYGTPWHGEKRYSLNERAPLTQIYFLRHGPAHQLVELPPAQRVAMMVARSFLPLHSTAGVQFSLDLCQELVRSIPCQELYFRPEASVISFLKKHRLEPQTCSFVS